MLESLIAAGATNDEAQIVAICRANQATIETAFAGWWSDRVSVRGDEERVRYCLALAFTAAVFENILGNATLRQFVEASTVDQDSPDPYQLLEDAKQHFAAGHYERGRETLESLVGILGEFAGPGVPRIESMSHGGLGRSYMAVGRATEAIEHWRTALDVCVREGDLEGVTTYTGLLFQAYRYCDQASDAARAAELHAQALDAGGDPNAAWYRHEAQIVTRGEPLLRMTLLVGGRRYETEEGSDITNDSGGPMRVDIAYWRSRPTLERATRVTSDGMARLSSGRLVEAIDLLAAAGDLDPFDPHPRYNAGMALLLLGRFREALERFEETERLAPGWFRCRRYAWLAREIDAGRLPKVLAEVLLRTDGDDRPIKERIKLLRPAIAAFPKVGWLHLNLADASAANGDRAAALAGVQRGLACDVDPDVRTTLLVKLATLLPASSERQGALANARALNGNIKAAAMAALMAGGPPRQN